MFMILFHQMHSVLMSMQILTQFILIEVIVTALLTEDLLALLQELMVFGVICFQMEVQDYFTKFVKTDQE